MKHLFGEPEPEPTLVETGLGDKSSGAALSQQAPPLAKGPSFRDRLQQMRARRGAFQEPAGGPPTVESAEAPPTPQEAAEGPATAATVETAAAAAPAFLFAPEREGRDDSIPATPAEYNAMSQARQWSPRWQQMKALEKAGAVRAEELTGDVRSIFELPMDPVRMLQAKLRERRRKEKEEAEEKEKEKEIEKGEEEIKKEMEKEMERETEMEKATVQKNLEEVKDTRR